MDGFKAKTIELRKKIDEAEGRERDATKKLDDALNNAEKVEEQVFALKRRKQLLEQKLDDVEERFHEKDMIYQDQLLKKEREDRQRKILDELEEEDERKMEKLEGLIKRYGTTADYNENKCAECWRRLQTVTSETERYRKRWRSADNRLRELEEENKFVGRNLRKLAVNEEKRGDREEAYENKIRELWQLTRDEEIRREAADRKIGRMKLEKSVLLEKLDFEKQQIDEARRQMDETMNGLDRV